MRQIIFDTETTGMNPNRANGHVAQGHRVVEIGCVELIDRLPTGNHFHLYLNPERPVDPEAYKVHGISDDYLADKPVFADVIEEFEAYLAGADELIAHNISFDRVFLDQELALAGRDYTLSERFTLVDTLQIAREKFPGARLTLDALCTRFAIDNSNRSLHGALLDSQLLAEVYLKLTGGQSGLWEEALAADNAERAENLAPSATLSGQWLRVQASDDETQADARIRADLQPSP